MSIVQCPNGHFYNNETFAQCPICSGVGSMIPDIAIPSTSMGASSISASSDEDGPTEYLSEQDEGKTVAIYDTQAFIVKPVVGWLVCCEGQERGQDYRLTSEISSIGRGGHNKIDLQDDSIPENESPVMLAYAEKKHLFIISSPSDSSVEVLLNGTPLRAQTILQPKDEIRIGKTMLRFIPFCDDSFSW